MRGAERPSVLSGGVSKATSVQWILILGSAHFGTFGHDGCPMFQVLAVGLVSAAAICLRPPIKFAFGFQEAFAGR